MLEVSALEVVLGGVALGGVVGAGVVEAVDSGGVGVVAAGSEGAGAGAVELSVDALGSEVRGVADRAVLVVVVTFLELALEGVLDSVDSVAVAGAGAGAAAGVPASATTVDLVSVDVVVSLAGVARLEEARLEVGAGTAAIGLLATS